MNSSELYFGYKLKNGFDSCINYLVWKQLMKMYKIDKEFDTIEIHFLDKIYYQKERKCIQLGHLISCQQKEHTLQIIRGAPKNLQYYHFPCKKKYITEWKKKVYQHNISNNSLQFEEIENISSGKQLFRIVINGNINNSNISNNVKLIDKFLSNHKENSCY